jgi:hypothetical protein
VDKLPQPGAVPLVPFHWSPEWGEYPIYVNGYYRPEIGRFLIHEVILGGGTVVVQLGRVPLAEADGGDGGTVAVVTDQPDHSGSAMLALYPPLELAGRLGIPTGVPLLEMHCTLAYIGKASQVPKDALTRAAKRLTSRGAIRARIGGHAVFTGGPTDVLVALVDSADLELLRRDTHDALRAEGIEPNTEHGYTAHITIRYLDEGEDLPFDRLDAEDFTLPAISVVHGDDREDLPFRPQETTIAPYARTAYAQGWAASGGPMTERVMAGCTAAIQLCCENSHQPGILEVAIHLGQLEGIWATVFERRYKLMADMETLVSAIWRMAVAEADVAGTVVILRQQLAIGEDSQDEQDFLRRAKAVARELAIRMLSWIPSTTKWQTMRDTMRKLVASGRAEGYADAIAIAAAEEGKIGISFDIAFKDAYTAMENLGETWAESDIWLNRMLGRAADQFGRTLGELSAAGASYQEMIDAGIDILDLTAEDADAVAFTVDWALSAGFSRGALDLYRSENVEYVTWMTAGDGRVCVTCEQHGIDSPFLITDFPDMPAHPRCRCVATAEFSISPAYDGYF